MDNPINIYFGSITFHTSDWLLDYLMTLLQLWRLNSIEWNETIDDREWWIVKKVKEGSHGLLEFIILVFA